MGVFAARYYSRCPSCGVDIDPGDEVGHLEEEEDSVCCAGCVEAAHMDDEW